MILEDDYDSSSSMASNETVLEQKTNDDSPITSTSTVNKVSVKVPPFWNENPQIWFSQVEAQFSNSGITSDSSKFNTVVAAMESKVLAQISDAVINPPAQGKYDNLKSKLLTTFGATENEKIRKLLTGMELGDRRPSQLLQEMRHLGGQQTTEALLENLWMNRLPTQVTAILQASVGDLNGKAALADKIVEVTGSSMIQQASTSIESSLQKQIQELTQQFQQFVSRNNHRSRSGSRHQSPHHNNNRQRSQSKHRTECWYHQTFKDKAKKCSPPCSSSSQPKN